MTDIKAIKHIFKNMYRNNAWTHNETLGSFEITVSKLVESPTGEVSAIQGAMKNLVSKRVDVRSTRAANNGTFMHAYNCAASKTEYE